MIELQSIFLFIILGIGAWIDYRKKRIPIWLPVVGILGGALWQVFLQASWLDFTVSLLPGIVLLFISLITNQKVGYGDGLMLCVVGACTDVVYSGAVALLSLFLSSVSMLYLLMRRKVNLKSQIPFLPFLFVGYAILLGGL